MRRGFIRSAIALVATALAAGQSGAADLPQADALIRMEEARYSEILNTTHMLADVYGPRLTASPSAKAAAEWTIARMRSWGLGNAHLEPWTLDHPGWRNVRAEAEVFSPDARLLSCGIVAQPETNSPSLNADIIAHLKRGDALLRMDGGGRPYGVIGDGVSVRMRFDIRNQSNAEGRTAYNAVAEIPGTDKANELAIRSSVRLPISASKARSRVASAGLVRPTQPHSHERAFPPSALSRTRSTTAWHGNLDTLERIDDAQARRNATRRICRPRSVRLRKHVRPIANRRGAHGSEVHCATDTVLLSRPKAITFWGTA